MKSKLVMFFAVFLSMAVIPVAALDFSDFSFQRAKATLLNLQPKEEAKLSYEEFEQEETVKVMASSSGNIISMTELEYVIGCVASEVPASYHEEALKAQAIAAYTNLIRLKQHPDSSLNGADISDSPKTHQGYFTKEQRQEKWGKNYEKYSQKLEKAVREVAGVVMVYEDEPIVAAYCAISPGRTEAAEIIWGSNIPYLQSIASSADKLSPEYSSTLVLSEEQFKQAMEKEDGIKLEGDAKSWISDVEYSKNGTGVVTKIKVGTKTLTGAKLRALVSLKSPSFTVEYKNGSFTFEVSGYGHCVGMSQYGADYMARNGSNYKEILKHYYHGVDFTKAV